MRDGPERLSIVGVNNEARDIIVLIRNDSLGWKRGQRQIRERHLRGDAFLGGLGRDAGQLIPGTCWRGPREEGRQRAETILNHSDAVPEPTRW